MVICIDFDGTCVAHDYPNIGYDIGSVQVLRRLVEEGHKLVLFTMRSNITDVEGNGKEILTVKGGNYLDDAVNWFKENNIPLYGINVNPEQILWTTSPKAYGHLYIDDAALGIPLIDVPNERPYVNWIEVIGLLKSKGILTK